MTYRDKIKNTNVYTLLTDIQTSLDDATKGDTICIMDILPDGSIMSELCPNILRCDECIAKYLSTEVKSNDVPR